MEFREHSKKGKVFIFIIIVLILILIYFPRTLDMALNINYIAECDELGVIVNSFDGQEFDKIIIKDKARIRKIFDYINSYKVRWSPEKIRVYSNDINKKSFHLWFKGENFHSDIIIRLEKYLSVSIDNLKAKGYKDFFFEVYGKGIDSEELLNLLMIEVEE